MGNGKREYTDRKKGGMEKRKNRDGKRRRVKNRKKGIKSREAKGNGYRRRGGS